MGFDADARLRGVFYTEVVSSRSLFEGPESSVLRYIVGAFLERSEIAKFFNKLVRSFTS